MPPDCQYQAGFPSINRRVGIADILSGSCQSSRVTPELPPQAGLIAVHSGYFDDVLAEAPVILKEMHQLFPVDEIGCSNRSTGLGLRTRPLAHADYPI